MKLLKFIVLIHLFLVSGCVSNSQQETPNKPIKIEVITPAPKSANLRRFPIIECDSNASYREEVRARHIVVETSINPSEIEISNAHAKAVEARAELLNGKSFSVVEREYSVGANSRGVNGGDLGFFKRGVMVKEFEDMAFCLPVNTIGPVFSTDFGFHIIEVTEIK